MYRPYHLLVATLVLVSIGIVVLPHEVDTNLSLSLATSTPSVDTLQTPSTSTAKRTVTEQSIPKTQLATAIQPHTELNKNSATTTITNSNVTETATLKIEGHAYSVEAHQTVIDAMRALNTAGSLSFTGREYPSLGFFIESINGKQHDHGRYWMLYINGARSGKGASNTTLLPGDTIEWRYE